MKGEVKTHFTRVKEAVNNVYSLNTLSNYIEKYVFIDGKRYEFGEKYYFQRDIIDDTARVNNVVKPAQIGITTATIAYMLAALATQRPMNVIYALPSASDASKLATTKVNPLIIGSPEIQRLVNSEVNSSELKQIGSNFLYIRGTKSETAALSISADILVLDELDRADMDTVKQFRSRLQASDHKIIRQFSTPTLPSVGISKEAENSKRYRHFATCKHCLNQWLPSFHTDIVIPNFDKDLTEINKHNLKDVNWERARWKCPKCGNDPELHRSRLTWVCENPDDNYEANTYYITPVTAYGVLVPSYLVRSSTEYNTRAEFLNQVLGETSEELNEQLTQADIDACTIQQSLVSGDLHCFGADMGLICHVAVGRLTTSGTLLVVHREKVPLHNFEKRRAELMAAYRCITSVHDVQPYVDLVTRLTNRDSNAFGCVFTTSKSPEMFTLQEKSEDEKEGKLNLRLAKANRTAALDALLALFKNREIVLQSSDIDAEMATQYLSLRRLQVFDKEGEINFQWVKSEDKNDHGFFALLYLLIACKLRGTAGFGGVFGTRVPIVSSFRVKQG